MVCAMARRQPGSEVRWGLLSSYGSQQTGAAEPEESWAAAAAAGRSRTIHKASPLGSSISLFSLNASLPHAPTAAVSV